MKKTLLTTVTLLACATTYAQIPISNDGYHLYGPNSNWGAYLQVGGNGQVTNHAFVAATNGNLHLDSKAGYSTYINHYNMGNTLINPQGGSVSIGNFSPTELLDVSGNIRSARIRTATAIFKPNSVSSFNSFNSGQDPDLTVGWIAADFGGSDNASNRFVVGTGFNGKVIISTHSADLTNWGGDLIINPVVGNVGIGTFSPSEKLSVKGKIRAQEIKVEPNPATWPDYVFSRDYKPKSLPELEKYITENKHLPEMPTAKDVATHGVELGEMNKLLLKKMEEMTLLMIEMDKQITKQQREIIELKEKM